MNGPRMLRGHISRYGNLVRKDWTRIPVRVGLPNNMGRKPVYATYAGASYSGWINEGTTDVHLKRDEPRH